MVGRLALEKTIVGLAPELDLVIEIVEHEISPVGADREDGVTLSVGHAHDGDQQVGQRDALPFQRTPFLQRVILTIPVAVVGIGPVFGLAVIVLVGHRRHRLINGDVYAPDRFQEFVGEFERAPVGRTDRAFGRLALAEFVMPDRLRRQPARRHREFAVRMCRPRRTRKNHQRGAEYAPPAR